jgi:small subunit ribosomal protein S5
LDNRDRQDRRPERRDRQDRGDRGDREYMEKLVRLNRIAKVVKGGRRFSFSALTVVGDRNGRVGYGFGKANYVSDAIRKSIERAKRNLIVLPQKKTTIPHQVIGRFKSARVLLKPASPGTGIIAGGPVRAVMEAAGVRDILSKSQGSSNSMNIVKAVFAGIGELMDARKIAASRGKTLKEFWG